MLKKDQEIINFINEKYDEEVPRPVKFVLRRRANKIESLNLDDFPDSVLNCTVGEFIMILKDAYKRGKLEF